MDGEGKVVRREKVATTEREVLRVVREVQGKKRLAVEETELAQWLYVLLHDKVDELVICNAANIGKQAGPKTDFRDAAELADLLRAGRLRPVFHDAGPLMELRTLVSGYQDLVQDLVRSKNRYKALYRMSALPTSGCAFYDDSKKLKLLPTKAQRFVAAPLQAQVKRLEECQQEYKRQFEANARRYRAIDLVASIPGFGPVRSNEVVAIVVDPHRFADKYKFFSYAMLVSHRQMSDGRQYGSVAAHGRSQLKSIFKSAALSALQSDNAFRRKYDGMIAAGSSDKAARCAVARSLAATVLGVWKSDKKYDDNFQKEQSRRNAIRGRGKLQTLRAGV
jgi:transposase